MYIYAHIRTHICVYIISSSLYEYYWYGTNNPADASQTHFV